MRPALLLFLLALLSCQPRQPAPEPAQYNVPPEVEPYVQRFRDEAKKRGRAVVTDNLIIAFTQTPDTDMCGQCLLETGRTPRITLMADAYC